MREGVFSADNSFAIKFNDDKKSHGSTLLKNVMLPFYR